MYMNFKNYYCFHIWTKGFNKTILFKNDNDKATMVDIIVDVCSEMNIRLNAFDILSTHAHYLIGQSTGKGLSENLNAELICKNIEKCVYTINRRYGNYFRKRYQINGKLFQRRFESIKPVHNRTDFINKIRYIHLNACISAVYTIPEDDPYSSYPYYLAEFVNNPEIRQLPIISKIISDAKYLKIFNSLDLEFSIKQFGSSMVNSVQNFILTHNNELDNKNRNSKLRRIETNIQNFFIHPERISISAIGGHIIKRFLFEINNKEINENNAYEIVNSFVNFYIANSTDITKSFSMIMTYSRKEIDFLILLMKRTLTVNKIHMLTGLNRKVIKNIERT